MSRIIEWSPSPEVSETLNILKLLGCGDEDMVKNVRDGYLYKIRIGRCSSLDDKCVHLFRCDINGEIFSGEDMIKRLFMPLRTFHRLVSEDSAYKPIKT